MLVTSKCKNPIRVGRTICRPGIETSVTKADLDGFKSCNMGLQLYDLFFKVEEEPEMATAFKMVEEDEPETEAVESEPETEEEPEDWKFNPAIHKIKHRGGGKWYVMIGSEKIEGPLSPEDRMKYQAMENDS